MQQEQAAQPPALGIGCFDQRKDAAGLQDTGHQLREGLMLLWLEGLQAEGYDVVTAEDGDIAVTILLETRPDLILLDWMLPGQSGIEICRQIRARKETREIPIIMISARAEEVDLVRGLDTGADDYVTKPYSVRELIARVRSQLRKSHPVGAGMTLEFRGITLDGSARRVTRDGKEVHLGPTEFRLLATFLERPERVWSRDQLLERAWDRDAIVETRTVDVHVGRLRKALCEHNATDPIRTVRGAGYTLG